MVEVMGLGELWEAWGGEGEGSDGRAMERVRV